MAANQFTQASTALNAEQTTILAAFTDAETELSNLSAPSTAYLEIYWTGGRIERLYDSAQVSGLSDAEQYRLYPQLISLFNAATRALLYP